MYDELNSEELKFKILELRSLLNFYKQDESDRIRRKWKLHIFFYALMAVVIGATLITEIKILGNSNAKIALFCFTIVMILPGFIPLFGKTGLLEYKNLNSLTRKELEKEYYDLQKIEEFAIDRSARLHAGTYSNIIAFVVIFIISRIKTGTKNSLGQLDLFYNSFSNIELQVVMLIPLIIFCVGLVLSLPMTPKKYLKKKNYLINKLIFSFINNLENSQLNPKNK